jgi:uncharacterized SAM-binding protein YcdF (DUF218 family)
MPLGVVFFLLLLALVLLRKNKLRTAAGLLVLGLAVLWTASTPFVAGQIYRHIESRFPPTPMTDIPALGCMIVLGGTLGAALPPRIDVEMNEAVDRIYKTAALYRAGKAPAVIVTGGNQPWSESMVAEADLIRDLLMEWGVPKDAIFLEGSSRNTRENALYSKNILNAINCDNALLITSAAHMPRAVAAFHSVGVNVTPVSTDVRVVNDGMPALADFLPNAGALAMTSDGLREWIGQKVYAWQGWN